MTAATRFEVPDIHCGHCKMSIEGAVRGIDGIDRVEVLIDERAVEVAYDDTKTDPRAIVAAIESQGYVVAG